MGFVYFSVIPTMFAYFFGMVLYTSTSLHISELVAQKILQWMHFRVFYEMFCTFQNVFILTLSCTGTNIHTTLISL